MSPGRDHIFDRLGSFIVCCGAVSWPLAASASEAAGGSSAVLGPQALALVASLIALVAIILLVAKWRDHARMKVRLDAAEARLVLGRQLLHDAPIAACRLDASQKVVWTNRALRSLAGCEDDAIGEFLPPAALDLAERVRTKAIKLTESMHRVHLGLPRLFSVTGLPLPQDEVALFFIDHTALETLQADLAKHIAAETEVLQSLRSAIAIYGPDRRLHFANSAFARLWGLDRGWLEHSPTLPEVLEALRERRMLPEYVDFPAFKRAQLDMFQSLTEQREELLHLPDDTTLRLVVTPHPLGGLMFAYEDVTDTLALERSYNTLIEVQRETLDNLHEGIAVIGTDSRLKLFNPAFLRIWQMSRERLGEDVSWWSLVEEMRQFFPDHASWEARRQRFLRALSERIPEHGVDPRGDGSHVEYTSVPLPDGATLYSFVDVTDRERAERALREKNEALEVADRLKTEFIANVSYELRTPLNTIIGFSEILANQYFGELSPRQLEYSRGILESSQRLLQLINDILDLATIEAGYMELNLAETDLHTQLASVLGLMRERARSQQLNLVFDCRPSIGSIEADARRLKQVLFNLLTNACKFTPSGGTITLSARRERDEVAIAVSDTGVGIPEQDHQRVFGRFERGGRVSRQGGAGLGLSLVKSFVELHGGRVELTSVPNQGTTVICRLPARRADPQRERAKPVEVVSAK